MNEVIFKDTELALVYEFNKLKEKKSDAWSEDKYIDLRNAIKEHYLKEQDYTCFFCRQRYVVKSKRAWDAEHIISRSTHPSFMFEPKNLCITCPDCNLEKRDLPVLDRQNRVRFPQKSEAYKIVHPHFDNYFEHIQVIIVGVMYVGRTPKGRTTARVYGLDRFCLDAGLPHEKRLNDDIINLSKQLLVADSHNYEFIEKKILSKLILKHAQTLGESSSLLMIEKLS